MPRTTRSRHSHSESRMEIDWLLLLEMDQQQESFFGFFPAQFFCATTDGNLKCHDWVLLIADLLRPGSSQLLFVIVKVTSYIELLYSIKPMNEMHCIYKFVLHFFDWIYASWIHDWLNEWKWCQHLSNLWFLPSCRKKVSKQLRRWFLILWFQFLKLQKLKTCRFRRAKADPLRKQIRPWRYLMFVMWFAPKRIPSFSWRGLEGIKPETIWETDQKYDDRKDIHKRRRSDISTLDSSITVMVIRLSARHVNSPEISIQNKLCCLHRSIYLRRSFWMVICSKTSHGQVQPEVVQRMYKIISAGAHAGGRPTQSLPNGKGLSPSCRPDVNLRLARKVWKTSLRLCNIHFSMSSNVRFLRFFFGWNEDIAW